MTPRFPCAESGEDPLGKAQIQTAIADKLREMGQARKKESGLPIGPMGERQVGDGSFDPR